MARRTRPRPNYRDRAARPGATGIVGQTRGLLRAALSPRNACGSHPHWAYPPRSRSRVSRSPGASSVNGEVAIRRGWRLADAQEDRILLRVADALCSMYRGPRSSRRFLCRMQHRLRVSRQLLLRGRLANIQHVVRPYRPHQRDALRTVCDRRCQPLELRVGVPWDVPWH
jgi:hypothetical protein